MSDLQTTTQWDASQFKLQPDGTFRISIRGMAAMAGIDFSSLARSLRSAVAENPLPCARSLLAQGFDPVAVSTWGETGGIPEDAAPFILEHYGITAASPSAQARAVLLAFSRVGINAFLKEKLGVPVAGNSVKALPNQTLATVAQAIDLLNVLGGVDDRQQQILRDVVLQAAVKSGGGGLLPPAAPEEELISLSEYFIEIGCPVNKATKFATEHGKGVKACYRNDHDGEDPKTAKTFWNGKNIKVAIYPKAWLDGAKENFQELWQKFLK